MTKYDMACLFAPLVGADPACIVADPTPPTGAPRPKDAHLDSSDLERLGIGRRTSFTTAIPAILAPHLHAKKIER
jgi:dTDP-4-dehydrorhamnose reductase